MRNAMIALMFITVLMAGCASQSGESAISPKFQAVAGKINKIAVVDVTGQIYGEAQKNYIAGIFQKELMLKGYEAVERSEVQKILKEQDFQSSDVTSSTQAAQIGKILNVPAVILASIPEYGDKILMVAKLVDVETASILWIGEGEASTGKTAATLLGGAIGAATGAAVAGDSRHDRTTGAVIGGIGGGAAGAMFSPSESKVFKKLIREKVCSDLPLCSAM